MKGKLREADSQRPLKLIQFSCDVMTDMLVDKNKRSLITSFHSSTSNCTLLPVLLSVSLEMR